MKFKVGDRLHYVDENEEGNRRVYYGKIVGINGGDYYCPYKVKWDDEPGEIDNESEGHLVNILKVEVIK